jgi:radical SAM superfamily enzyme YgiQ (UPF0313 family)
MRKAGCETIKFGVESGSQRILNLIKKGINLQEVKDTREICKQAGIKFACFILLGIPSETYEERQRTLEFLKILKPDYLVTSIFIPTPKSPLYEEILHNRSYHHMDKNHFLYLSEFDKDELHKIQQAMIASWQAEQNKGKRLFRRTLELPKRVIVKSLTYCRRKHSESGVVCRNSRY